MAPGAGLAPGDVAGITDAGQTAVPRRRNRSPACAKVPAVLAGFIILLLIVAVIFLVNLFREDDSNSASSSSSCSGQALGAGRRAVDRLRRLREPGRDDGDHDHHGTEDRRDRATRRRVAVFKNNGQVYTAGCAIEVGSSSCKSDTAGQTINNGDSIAIIIGEAGTGVGDYSADWWFVFQPD